MLEEKIDIFFDCYPYFCKEGKVTLFLFWPDGDWDEGKYDLEGALLSYPLHKYNWIKVDEEVWAL